MDSEYWMEVRRRKARAADAAGAGPLFEQPAGAADAPLNRRPDEPGSIAAAEAVAPRLSDLQRLVLDELRRAGPSLAVELERRPAFAHLAPSTVRKRLTELRRMGQVVVRSSRRPAGGGVVAGVYEVA
jgi:hypothetical protein